VSLPWNPIQLTDAELLEIASPLKQPAAIVRWFRGEGFSLKTKPNGMPLITRSEFETTMGCRNKSAAAANVELSSEEPNVARLLARFEKRKAN
jgi:hypothetical protein